MNAEGKKKEQQQHESETMKGTQTKWIINEHHDDDGEISTEFQSINIVWV